MSRRCSHCGHNGHNSRTCFDKGFKLFGVRLTESSSCSSSSPSAMMRKSVSMGNLSHYGSSSSSEAASSSSATPLEQLDLGESLDVDGYASDDLVHTNSSVRERKKGVPWTMEEHRLFLLGLQKLGKGDWRGISRNFVKTRTPTQVASHAQKYFLRRSNLNKRRRRSSLFDMTPDAQEVCLNQVSSLSEESLVEEPAFERADACPGVHELRLRHGISGNREASMFSRHAYPVGGFSVSSTSLPLSCTPMDVSEVIEEAIEAEEIKDLDGCEMREVAEKIVLKPSASLSTMESVPEGNGESGGESDHFRFPYPLFAMWPGSGLHSNSEKQGSCSTESKIVKPIPMIPSPSGRIDNSIKESQRSVSSMRPVMEPTPLSYKLLEEGSRHSAFQTMNSVSSSKLDTQGSLSNAISVS